MNKKSNPRLNWFVSANPIQTSSPTAASECYSAGVTEQGNQSKLDSWFEPQMLHQETEMDCGVCVFGALAGLSREEIVRDIPDAVNGITLHQWDEYLGSKGRKLIRYEAGEEYPLPCAHLHKITPNHHHWIYQGCGWRHP